MYMTIFLSVVLCLLAWLYFRITKNYGSFKSRGYPEERGFFPVGSKLFWRLTFRYSSIREYADGYKAKYPEERFFAAWNFGQPVIVVLDVDLARAVLVKDFDYFPVRRGMVEIQNNVNKYFSNMMFNMGNVEKWKMIRTRVSPVFTSGKLKAMLPHLQDSSDRLINFIGEIDRDMVDSRDIVVRYTAQSIAKAGFGVEADCFKTDVDEPLFISMVNTITNRKGSKARQLLLLFSFLILPDWIVKIIPISFLDPESQDFFLTMIKQSVEARKKSKASRGDFVDLMMKEFYQKTSSTSDNIEDSQFDKDAQINVSDDLKKFEESELEMLLIANVFLLLFAGFETTSSMMTIMLVFLANNPEIQELMYQEITETIQTRNNGEERLNYNDIMGMKYLDQFIHESLRHFTFLTLERVCIRPYTIPGTDLTVDKGTTFIFPNDAFGMSEEHFKDPEKFEPNHFSEEEKKSNTPYRFMSFGQGPRNCVGMRFALLQIKTSLYRLVYNYNIVPNEKTVKKIVIPPKEFNPDIEGGAWVKLRKRHV